MLRRAGAGVVVWLMVCLPMVADACPVCIGNPDDPMTKAVSVGIFFMLGMLGIVFGGFAGLVFFIVKKKPGLAAKQSHEEISGEMENGANHPDSSSPDKN